MPGCSFSRYSHVLRHLKSLAIFAREQGIGRRVAFADEHFLLRIDFEERLELEMTELKDKLQNSMELERLRLAQELHDNPMQVLYSASYRLEELRTKVDPELSESLKGVKNIIQDVLHDLRATAKELRPPTIFSFGLENAIRSHAYDVQEKHPEIQLHLSLAHDGQSLPDNVRLALFRVLQQAPVNLEFPCR